jgi:ABC-type multidrug transport system fused ATPase/permease subunit
MCSDKATETEELKRPLSQIQYNVIVFLGVVLNAFLMILSTSFSNPSLNNPQGYFWFLLSIYIIVPFLGSFIYSLVASIASPRKYTISPVYVVIFSIIPAYLIGSYVVYEIYSLPPVDIRISQVMSYLSGVTVFYLIWVIASILVLQPIVRGLIGAFAERANIKSGTLFYTTSTLLGNILEKIEDSEWLSDLCSMEIFDRKEKEDELKLRFNKHKTNFYLVLYAKKESSETHVSLTPYELEENLVKKIIRISEDSKHYLQPQIEEFEKVFKLDKIQAEKSDIVYESLNYAMLPVRFPAIIIYGKQISIAALMSIGSILVGISYFTGVIKEVQTVVGIIALIVTIGSTAINILSRR